MSEKAKGKQRAPPEYLQDENQNQASAPGLSTESEATSQLSASVRFTDSGIPDFLLYVRRRDLAQLLKERIREARPQLTRRKLRLIINGQLLGDNDLVHPLLSIDGSQRWIHCSVGQELEPGETDSDGGKAQTAQLRAVKGFERLLTMGFTEDEIVHLRQQFHRNLDPEEFDSEESFRQYILAAEDDWIDSMATSQMPTLASGSLPIQEESETNSLHGGLLGFFLPMVTLFFLREPPPPIFWENGGKPPEGRSIIRPRMAMTIVLGFLSNLLFAVWRYSLGS